MKSTDNDSRSQTAKIEATVGSGGGPHLKSTGNEVRSQTAKTAKAPKGSKSKRRRAAATLAETLAEEVWQQRLQLELQEQQSLVLLRLDLGMK